MSTEREPRDFADLWDFGDAAASEKRFRALAEGSGADVKLQAEALTQVARALGLQRQYRQAQQVLDDVGRLLGPGMEIAHARLLLERGRVLNSSGRKDEARPLFLQAWEAARHAGLDVLAVDAAHMVAIVEQGEEALAWNERAMELARGSRSEAARRWLASLYNNIGWTYHEMGRFEDALRVFRLAAEERERQGKPGPHRIARWCVARALRSLGRFEEALVEQRRLADLHAAAGSRDGFVHEEIAECLLALGRDEEARAEFARALEILLADEGPVRAEPGRIERLRRLARG